MRCKGCKADFGIGGTELPVYVLGKHLCIDCPCCDYTTQLKILDGKWVEENE